MKLTTLLLTAAFLNVSARGVSQKITLNADNAPLETVFRAIEKQTKFTFFYQPMLLKTGMNVTLHVSDLPLKEVLDRCFSDQPFTWSIEGRIITLEARPSPPATAVLVMEDTVVRPAALSGTILGDGNQPLAGATVVVKSTGKGTNTNAKGQFGIKSVDQGTVLVVSFIGYNKVEHKVGTDKYVTLRMVPATSTLDVKVVMAYGSTSQRYATGNISTVTAKEIEKQPVMNPLFALQGQVPGMVITPNNNALPSASVKVEIRGRNSLNPNLTSEPLYVIDGVPLSILQVSTSSGTASSYAYGSTGFLQNNSLAGPTYGGGGITGQSPLFNVNPADIESISVLKDADATALYGARAANGVILITTKHGQAGPTKVEGRFDQGTSFITRYWDMLDEKQYLAMRHEAFTNSGITPTASNAPDLLLWDTTRNYNWQKFLWGRHGMVSNAQVAVSGGDARTVFRLGIGYNRQNDITTSSGLNQRISSSLNLSHSSQDRRLSMSLSAAFSQTVVNAISVNTGAAYAPDAPPIFDAKGNLNYAGWSPYAFYFASLKQPYNNRTNFLNANLLTSYTIMKGLTARVSVGGNLASGYQVGKSPISSYNPATTTSTASITIGRNDNNNWQVEPQLEYNVLIGRGKLNALVLGSLSTTTTEGLATTGSGIASDAQLGTISNATTFRSSDNWGQQKVASLLATIGYNWAGKYIITLNGRRDGSTNFAPDNRFGSFGSVGAAWIPSEERWVKNILPSFVSFIKLRASYGTTGGSGATPFSYLSQWASNYANYPYGGVQTTFPQIHASPDYHWEVDKKLDAGFSLGFLHDRITLDAAYYRNRCDNQLTPLPTPAFTGFSSVTGNLPANVQNSGLEIGTHALIMQTRKFSWSANFNISFNRNKLLAFPNLAQSTYTNTYVIGKPLNFIYLYNFTGVDPQTGKNTFVDHDQNGVIGPNSSAPIGTDDRYIFTKLDPSYYGGLQQSFSYAGFTVSVSAYFKKQMSRNALYGYNVPGTQNNMSAFQYAHTWHKPGDHALFPMLTTTGDNSYYYYNTSTGLYTNASFIRINQLSLSYSLPDALLKKSRIRSLTFNIYTNNLFTISKYIGVDPEVSVFGTVPPARIIQGGLSCSF